MNLVLKVKDKYYSKYVCAKSHCLYGKMIVVALSIPKNFHAHIAFMETYLIKLPYNQTQICTGAQQSDKHM